MSRKKSKGMPEEWQPPKQLKDWRPWTRGHRMISVVGVGVVAVLWFATARVPHIDKTGIAALKIGDCVEIPYGGIFNGNDVKKVSCKEPHLAEVYAIGNARTTKAPNFDRPDDAEIERICEADVSEALVATIGRDASETRRTISAFDQPKHLVCVALTQSPRTTSFVQEATA